VASGYLEMTVAVCSDVGTTISAQQPGWTKGFNATFRAGAVVGVAPQEAAAFAAMPVPQDGPQIVPYDLPPPLTVEIDTAAAPLPAQSPTMCPLN
jgi:hypothetical protein